MDSSSLTKISYLNDFDSGSSHQLEENDNFLNNVIHHHNFKFNTKHYSSD